MKKAEDTVRQFFAAMQAGATAHADMVALFAEDAEYQEPFTGRSRTHRGLAAIKKAMAQQLSQPFPQMRIEVDHLVVEGDTLRAEWTCHSPALPGGKGRGENLFTLRDGRIIRLETRLT